MTDWKAKQAANRQLLEESQRTRAGRNTRDFGEQLELAGINKARAAVIAQIATQKVDNLSKPDAENAAFDLLQLFSTMTDEEAIKQICEGKPAKKRAPAPKPAAEIIKETQGELFSAPPRKVHFVLPYPPSANRYWKHAAVFSKTAGKYIAVTYLSEEAETYKELIRLFCNKHNIKPFLNDVVLTAYVYRPQLSGDLGNRLKVIEDSLEGIIYLNDSQIAESHHFRREDKHRPRVEIFLEEIKS